MILIPNARRAILRSFPKYEFLPVNLRHLVDLLYFFVFKEHELKCTACKAPFHIECLAKIFLKQDSSHLMPIGGECGMCEKQLLWGNLIKSCF